MKVVINKCYGGFGLSDLAIEWLRDHEGMEARETSDKESFLGKYFQPDVFRSENTGRADPRVVRCVEALGEKANGRFSRLRIVEIPDGIDWEIDEYDGQESIAEKHRSWG